MLKYKINSLNGKSRSHSILTTVVPFLEGILEHTPVNSICSDRIVHYNRKPEEPVEIREISIEKRHYIRARVYGEESFQEFYLYCHKDNFLKVMNYINEYCSKRG